MTDRNAPSGRKIEQEQQACLMPKSDGTLRKAVD
jgi:hypothetical protein